MRVYTNNQDSEAEDNQATERKEAAVAAANQLKMHNSMLKQQNIVNSWKPVEIDWMTVLQNSMLKQQNIVKQSKRVESVGTVPVGHQF